MQELLPKEIAKEIPPLYAQDGAEDPIAYVHLFSCLNGWDWYIAELDRESGEAFGLVKGFETEWGYFSIPEMENLNRSKGFEVIERDEHFAPASMGRVAD